MVDLASSKRNLSLDQRKEVQREVQSAWKARRETYLWVGGYPSHALSLPQWIDFSPTSLEDGALLNSIEVLSGLQVGCVTFPSPWGAASPRVKDLNDDSVEHLGGSVG